jgi:hypothetical protein
VTKPWTTRTLTMANYMARKRVQNALVMAEKLNTDPDKEKRLEAQRCLSCFYFVAIVGQAFTDANCACCGKHERYSNTSTDLLCVECACRDNLCKHCGADINLNNDRKHWPTDNAAGDAS